MTMMELNTLEQSVLCIIAYSFMKQRYYVKLILNLYNEAIVVGSNFG